MILRWAGAAVLHNRAVDTKTWLHVGVRAALCNAVAMARVAASEPPARSAADAAAGTARGLDTGHPHQPNVPPGPRRACPSSSSSPPPPPRRAAAPLPQRPAARGHAARQRRPAGQSTVFTPRQAWPAVVARRIILEAMRASSGSRGSWRVGTTDDPRRSRRERRSPPTWSDWDAGSAGMARAIEGRLAGLGMRRDRAAPSAPGSGGANARHVYVFRG